MLFKLSILANIFFLFTTIFFIGQYWTRSQVYELSGNPTRYLDPIRELQGIDVFDLEDPVTKVRTSFLIPSHQIKEALKICNSSNIESPAIAKIIYQKNLWGGFMNPLLVITQCGQFGLHK